MSKQQIKHLIDGRVHEDGLPETSVNGVRLFRASTPIPCTPAVYEPCVVARFVKSMRLNNAAMKIAGGMTVTELAMNVDYVSPSQFSREFKRMYGQSPRQWSDARHRWVGMA